MCRLYLYLCCHHWVSSGWVWLLVICWLHWLLSPCSGLRSSPTGIFLGNLCVAVSILCVVFLIALFVGGSNVFCTVVAFLLHYLVLVVSLALPTMAFFMGFSPLAGKKMEMLHLAGIINNWGNLIKSLFQSLRSLIFLLLLNSFASHSCGLVHCSGYE